MPACLTSPIVRGNGPAAIVQAIGVPGDRIDVDPAPDQSLSDRDAQTAVSRRFTTAAYGGRHSHRRNVFTLSEDWRREALDAIRWNSCDAGHVFEASPARIRA
jgi:hypothetical protein